MAVTEARLRRELQALLQIVDFETETERTVREKLAKRLKCGNIDKWKPVIKVTPLPLATPAAEQPPAFSFRPVRHTRSL